MKEVKITKGYITLVDDEDYERISKSNWQAAEYYSTHSGKLTVRVKRAITIATSKRVTIQMCHEILGFFPFENRGSLVDHKDNNPLNNQKINLLITDYYGNAKNTDKFRNALGVTFDICKCRWIARAPRDHGNQKQLGIFSTREEALEAVKEYRESCV